ncbi:3-oxoacyl-(Acyl-carrier-protein) synthase III [gamma proteobacterium HdN1]|nr:3-oxoacyl-(Acyl-carrier-protein) synthase III [gamma proteobacterium HdN1]
MSQSTSAQVCISGTGLFTPVEIVTNEELVASFNAYVTEYNESHAAEIADGTLTALQPSSEEFIVKASGIKQRYVMNKSGVLDPHRLAPCIAERPDEERSIQCEMAVAAATQALENARRKGADVDAVIVACSNLQRPYPAVAIEVQAAIGARGFAYDMNVACSSATFGLQAARDAVLSGAARCVLVVNPEICSAHLAWQDRDCHFIFGDVCTAMVVERVENAVSETQWEIVNTRLVTEFSNNIRNNFGFLNRCDESGIGARDKLFRQNGRKVFKEVVPMVAELISKHLHDAGLDAANLKRMWLHQANLGMNHLIAKKVLGRDAELSEAPVILDEYANTSSAGSIIAFHKYSTDLAKGDIGVICSFGAGYSAGSIIVRKL